jgi:hypothetical protein
MEVGLGIVWGLRVLWGLAIAGALIGLLPLGAVSEFVRDLSRRGKLKLASTAKNPPVRALPLLVCCCFLAHWLSVVRLGILTTSSMAVASHMGNARNCQGERRVPFQRLVLF